MEHTVYLVTGYTEKGVTHTEVTFGRRLRGRPLFDISAQAEGVEYDSRLYQAAVTRFGSLPSPIPLKGVFFPWRLLTESFLKRVTTSSCKIQ